MRYGLFSVIQFYGWLFAIFYFKQNPDASAMLFIAFEVSNLLVAICLVSLWVKSVRARRAWAESKVANPD